MELPVVALANGGTVEIVEHGVTGLLSRAGDVDELADNLAMLLGRAANAAESGASRWRRGSRSCFTTQRMVARRRRGLRPVMQRRTDIATPMCSSESASDSTEEQCGDRRRSGFDERSDEDDGSPAVVIVVSR